MRRVFVVAALATAVLAAPVIDRTTLTTSGISAGGAFAVQYAVAHSSKVRAAGVIAGTPYYCSGGSGVSGAYECMDDPMLVNIPLINAEMNISASEGNIDPLHNIAKQSITLFSGIFDTVVNHGTMVLLQQQYQDLGVKNLVAFFNYTAEHAWITNYYGNSCSTLGSPYINNCGLDFAGVFLRQAWESMGLHFNEDRKAMNPSALLQFSQVAFGANSLTNSLDTNGYYYIPNKCLASANSTTRCHVHVNFHGCTQEAATLGTTYVANTGLNQWAESNNIIVVYPQIAANILLENPNACFDWWGYAGSNFANKQGVQITFVEAIVNALYTTGTLPPPQISPKH